MRTRVIQVTRLSIVSSDRFDQVVERLPAAIGHPDMKAFRGALAATRTAGELEKVVDAAIGSSGLMEFDRFDLGEVLRKDRSEPGPRILRLVLGNPLIMKEMVRHTPDAASHAPVTILVDERADGVHLSYDSMESHLAPYGNLEALVVARGLDAKIENLLRAAASSTGAGSMVQAP